MTNYGTIPTSASGETSPQGFISRAKARGRSALATRRPWRELIYLHYFSLPRSLGETYIRIRSNTIYFAMNYIIFLLLLVFLSLLWHPVSLIVFILMMAFWLFLYFLRDEPVAIFGRTIDDRLVLVALSIVTLVLLLLTDATGNILISLLVGVVVVLIHAALRRSDDLSLEEEGAGPRGWYAAAGDGGGGGSLSP
ncbi:PRA1 family protein F2-like [Phalaenopsis equestris]|uniref:PRA1 family protein F2-like n=1 Tax=Phalaenopsis equestris TaxID=78828 RepID=UPI0009E65A8B|nr:PRA1 family protein F2-like [Phalaenopsis equestris]